MIMVNTMNLKRTTSKGSLAVPDFYSKAEEVKRAAEAIPDWGKAQTTSALPGHLDQEWEDILQEVTTRSHIDGKQAEDLHYAVELLTIHDIARAEFWKHYLPNADKVIPKRGRKEVAVACFFQEIVVVEFAPVGHAAYFYQREMFETQVMGRTWFRPLSHAWKNKQYTHHIGGVTNMDGTFHHLGFWQTRLARFLDSLIGR